MPKVTNRLHIVTIPYVPRSALLTTMRLDLQSETQICRRHHGSLTSRRKLAYKHQLVSWGLSDSKRTSVTFCLLFYYVRPHPRKSGTRECLSTKLPKRPFFCIFHRWGRRNEARLAEVRYPPTSSYLVAISFVLPVSRNSS